MKTKVVTWMSPGGGQRMNICPTCETRLDEGHWPKDRQGRPYSQVHRGLHWGRCEAPCHPLTLNLSRRWSNARPDARPDPHDYYIVDESGVCHGTMVYLPHHREAKVDAGGLGDYYIIDVGSAEEALDVWAHQYEPGYEGRVHIMSPAEVAGGRTQRGVIPHQEEDEL